MLGQHLLWQTQFAPDSPHFIFEQFPQRLDQRERQVLRKSSDIVVRLNSLRGTSNRHRLDHIRIESPLHEESRPVRTAGHLAGLLIEYGDKFSADPLPLVLRVRDTLEALEKALRSVHTFDLEAHPLAQKLQRLSKFIFPKQPVIDKNVRQPVADGAVHQHGCHGGIHSSAQRANRSRFANLLANRFYRLRDKGRPAPQRPRVANPENKIAQDFGTAVRMPHLGMKLDGVKFPRRVFRSGHRVSRLSGHVESCRESPPVIAVAVPNAQPMRQARDQSRTVLYVKFRPPILSTVSPFHTSAQHVRHPLQAVANPEHRDAERQYARIARRRACVIHGVRSARQHHASRLVLQDLLDARRARQNRAEHLLLADSPRDQLCILPAEIKHYDAAALTHRFLAFKILYASAGPREMLPDSPA